jgi:hypothetical protein
MKPASKIKKGRRLENKIASLWRRKTKDLGIRTPGSGSGTKHKEDIYTRHFSIEAKNQEKVQLWKFWEQARSQKSFGKPPVLCISGNYRPIVVVMDIDDWLDLVVEAKYED